MFKKILLLVIMSMALFGKVSACSWYDADLEYYNLFSQDIMNDPRYRPFLVTLESRYYPHDILRNGNIQEWQEYLGLSYDDTRYLVFDASRDDLRNLTKGKPASDRNLAFATPEFVTKHKQALLYLAYAKYLEPYMHICPSEEENENEYYWDYEDSYEHHAGELEYEKVKTVLTKSYAAETDKELKLRYAYQMVRLAHYTRRYKEAVQLFDTYVRPLGLTTEMYYYALSQKAGALRGQKKMEQANRIFVNVFANSADLKTAAYTSMTLGWDNEISFADFLDGAANDEERNEIYLLMGYRGFNNPTNEIEKIVANNPDAIQAKVLMVRAINLIERELLPTYDGDPYCEKGVYPEIDEQRSEELRPFMKQTIKVCDQQCTAAKDKNFWNLASSYLHFLQKDFDKATSALNAVHSNDELYMATVDKLTAYIDICRQSKFTADVENELYAKYEDLMTGGGDIPAPFADPFIMKVIANRYFRQSDKAKAFLVLHNITDIETNLKESLLDEIKNFLDKKGKNDYEKYLASSSTYGVNDYDKYLAYVKGVVKLTNGDLKEAKPLFKKQGRLTVSKRIFGNNIRVWYSGEEDEIMRDDYIAEFAFIKNKMSELDVTEALLKLQEIADEDSDKGAKANYLMGNFFYNVSLTGYYRHYLRFDNNNAYNWEKFSFYSGLYQNTLPLAAKYFNAAYARATDEELVAHILFGKAKVAQQDNEREGHTIFNSVDKDLYRTFGKYSQTNFYKDVFTNCTYYSDFSN